MSSVLHVSTVHRPTDTRIRLKQVATLQEAGIDVRFLVPALGDSDDPLILSLPRNRGRLHRVTLQQVRAIRRCLSERPDIVHVHDPELLPLAAVLKLVGRRVICDVHENVREQMSRKSYLPRVARPLLVALWTFLSRLVMNRVDLVIAATPAIADALPVPATVVQNFAISSELWSPSAPPMRDRPKRISFVGGITEARGLDVILAALEALGGEVELVLAGSFRPPELETAVLGHPHVQFVGQLDRAEVRELLATSRAGLVLYQRGPNHGDAQPTKMFEYMSAGLPVIASDFPLWRTFVSATGVGILVDETDPTAVASAVRRLLDDPAEGDRMGIAGRRAVETTYSWEAQASTLVDAYERLPTRSRVDA